MKRMIIMSLPSRERGLKSVHEIVLDQSPDVAPLAGARIEIAPGPDDVPADESLPSRERGLKFP